MTKNQGKMAEKVEKFSNLKFMDLELVKNELNGKFLTREEYVGPHIGTTGTDDSDEL